jgi:alcohol dehydrogenase YqhD (iron-dependent ADH family)
MLRGSIPVHPGRGIPSVPINNTATMTQDYKPKTHAAALAVALVLAITASNNEQAKQSEELAARIAEQMNDEVRFEAVKEAVEACIAYFSEMPA